MKSRKRLQHSIGLILIIIILTGCASKATQPKEPAVSDRSTQTATATQQPTPTETLVPTATTQPTTTPTTPPLQPAQLTIKNIQNIQMISSSEFFELGALQDAEWSPDGEVLAVTTDRDIQIVDAETLEIMHQLEGYEFVRFLDDGNILLTDGQGLPSIMTKDSFELNHLLPSDWSYAYYAIAISYDGKTIADVSTPNLIKLIDIESGESTEFIYYLKDYKEIEPTSASFSPDQHFLYVIDRINDYLSQLIIFDLEINQLLSQHSGYSRLPVFSPDGKWLVFNNSLYTSIMGFWDDLVGSYAYVKSVEEMASGGVADFSFVKDSSQVGLLYQGTVHNYVTDDYRFGAHVVIFNTNDNSVVHVIDDLSPTSFKVDFNPNGDQFFTLSKDGYIQIWSTSDGKLLCTSQAYKPNSNLVVSPDGTMYAYTIGNTIQFFNASNGELISEFSDPDLSREKSLAFQGNDIIAISRDWQIDTFVIATGEWVRNYPQLNYCGFNPTGTTLICTSGDFELYDASTGRALIKVRPERSYRYAVSDDGAYTAYCNYGSETVFLYDNQKGTQIQFLKMNNQPACGSMDFSDDGQFLVSSLGAVWEIPSGDLVTEIGALGYGSISISPNNEFVLAYPGIYSLKDGSMLANFEADIGWVQKAWFLPDGFNIVVLGENSLQFWGVLE
jgi:WD40 repeat protein